MSKKLWDRIREIGDVPGWGLGWMCPEPEAEYLKLAQEMIRAGVSEDQAVAWLKRAYEIVRH